jgi:hypothetical protein
MFWKKNKPQPKKFHYIQVMTDQALRPTDVWGADLLNAFGTLGYELIFQTKEEFGGNGKVLWTFKREILEGERFPVDMREIFDKIEEKGDCKIDHGIRLIMKYHFLTQDT